MVWSGIALKPGIPASKQKKKESHSVGLVLTDFPLDLSNPQQASPDTVYNPPWLADDFVDAITDDPKVSSFNVTSLFTSIPLQLALQVVLRPPSTNDTANHLFSQTILYGPTTPLSDLDLLFVQLQGTAMGSPVSIVVAKVVSRKGLTFGKQEAMFLGVKSAI